MDLAEAAQAVNSFNGDSLTKRLAELEFFYQGLSLDDVKARNLESRVTSCTIEAMATLKKLAGQINVSIHAIGILSSLPHILLKGEKVESLSLGAGNTGRLFDLTTSHRVAEFKFISWRGGAEAIRQNSLFKDFYELAEYSSPKLKCLYLLGLTHPMRFLHSQRSIDSVLSRNNKLHRSFISKYGNDFKTVEQYYLRKQDAVQIIDLIEIVPGIRAIANTTD